MLFKMNKIRTQMLEMAETVNELQSYINSTIFRTDQILEELEPPVWTDKENAKLVKEYTVKIKSLIKKLWKTAQN